MTSSQEYKAVIHDGFSVDDLSGGLELPEFVKIDRINEALKRLNAVVKARLGLEHGKTLFNKDHSAYLFTIFYR